MDIDDENNNENQEESENLSSMRRKQDGNLYRKLDDKDDDEDVAEIIRCCATPEARRSFYVNPVVFSQLSGIGVFAFLDQFLKLWPSARIIALPYLSIPSVVTGAIGFGMGTHSLYHPRDEYTNPLKRVWFAVGEGFGVVFSFLMGEEIYIYCSKQSHLDADNNCMVSEATFWDSFFPAPVLLGGGYAVWKSIPLSQKKIWISQKGIKKTIVVGLDSLADILFYSRVFQALAANISIPQLWVYELAAVPAAGVVLVIQIFKPQHSEKFRMLITTGMTINLMVYFAKFLAMEFSSYSEEDSYSWAPMLKSIIFPAFFVIGAIVTIWRSRQRAIESKKEKLHVRADNLQLLIDQQIFEALNDPTVRGRLVQRLLQDEQTKQELLKDAEIKALLLQDPSIRDQLKDDIITEDWGLEDVDLENEDGSTELTKNLQGNPQGSLEATVSPLVPGFTKFCNRSNSAPLPGALTQDLTLNRGRTMDDSDILETDTNKKKGLCGIL